MSGQEKKPHEIIRPPEDEARANASLIWRRQEAPVSGAKHDKDDRAFVTRALIGSFLALVVLCLLGILIAKNFTAVQAAYADSLLQRGAFTRAERVIEKMEDGEEKQALLKKDYAEFPE